VANLIPLNYWYAAKSNEIFLDLDNRRAISRAFNVLSKAVRRGDLHVKGIYIYPSSTKGHVHVIIVLREVMTIIDRLAWSLWMGNDRLRVAFILKRCIDEIPNEDLLMGNRRYHRPPDDICACTGKHKDMKITGKCEAMARLIGREAAVADYFTRTGRVGLDRVETVGPDALVIDGERCGALESLMIPWGRVSLECVKTWGKNGKRLL